MVSDGKKGHSSIGSERRRRGGLDIGETGGLMGPSDRLMWMDTECNKI